MMIINLDIKYLFFFNLKSDFHTNFIFLFGLSNFQAVGKLIRPHGLDLMTLLDTLNLCICNTNIRLCMTHPVDLDGLYIDINGSDLE